MSKNPFPADDEFDQPEQGPETEDELVGDEDDDQSAEKLAEKLAIFGSRLASRRDEWVQGRAAQGHDRRMQEDLDQYNGRDAANRMGAEMMTSVEQGFPITTRNAKATRSTVFVQVTRQKTNALAARWQDVAAPNDDRNFAVEPTPIPGLPSFVQVPTQAAQPAAPTAASAAAPSASGTADGAPPIGGPQQASAAPSSAPPQGAPQGQGTPAPTLTPEEQAAVDRHAEAKKRADAMQQEIDDDFRECDISAEQRKVMFDAALFGTGVMKGPQVVHRTRKAWVKRTDALGNEVWKLEVSKEIKPASYRIDPRRFYPDPLCGENLQNSRGTFEYDRKTKTQIQALAKQPGYIASQLQKVIEEGPQGSKALLNMLEREDRDMVRGDLWDHWIYWGEVEREDLELAGVEVSEDELTTVSACIEMINSTVVRAYLNPLPDGALPYDMLPCEVVPGSVWGYGVPYLMRSQQRVINAAWRMILDNAGVSSGPQIVMKPGLVRPADGQNTITARKIWYANDDVDDVRKAFTTFEFASHQAELAAIIDMADRLSDQETAVPMLSQGQQGSAPETVGGMQILMQGANVMLRRLVKQADDRLIKPQVRRYYDFHMEYSPKGEIKGDFQVVPLGSSTLVVRDIQNQAYQNLLAMGTNPAYAPFINLKNLFKKAVEASHIAPRDIMNSEAEIQQAMERAAQQQAPDPRVVAAEKRAESDQQRTQAQVEMNRETNQAKLQMHDADGQRTLEVARLNHEAMLMKLAHGRQDTLDNIRAQLAQTAIKERVKQDLHAADLQNQATQPA